MKIIGIDPGLATVGLGIVEADSSTALQAIDWLTITTPAGLPLAERLAEISRDIDDYLNEQQPDAAVVEQVFFATNQQTAIDVAQARGALVAAVSRRGIPVLDVSPVQLKLAITGDGQADKKQMQQMVQYTLKLDEIPQPDDAADAIAMAMYGALHQEFMLSVSSPA